MPKEGNDDIIIINDEEVTDVKYDVSKKIEKKNSSHLNSKLFTIKSDSSVSRSKLKEKRKSLLTGEKRSVIDFILIFQHNLYFVKKYKLQLFILQINILVI